MIDGCSYSQTRVRASSAHFPTFTSEPCSNNLAAMAAKGMRETATQLALIEELKAAAERLGLSVREERLLREVGYRVRSGSCRVGENEIIFLDRDLPAAAQVDVLVDELAARPTESIYLSPAARALIERASARGAQLDGGTEAVGG